MNTLLLHPQTYVSSLAHTFVEQCINTTADHTANTTHEINIHCHCVISVSLQLTTTTINGLFPHVRLLGAARRRCCHDSGRRTAGR